MLLSSECFISVYGTFRRHPWIDAENPREDAYSLFNKYAEALNWSDSAAHPEDGSVQPPGSARVAAMWGMNEAGGNWSDEVARTADHVLWVQTSLSQSDEQAGIPIAQLGLCAEKTLQRVGTVSLAAVQMMLPLDNAPVRLAHTWDALTISDPAARTDLQIEVEGGEDDACVRHATTIVEELNSLCESDSLVFSAATVSCSPGHLLEEPAEMNRRIWIGDSKGRVETRVTVPEFSLDVNSYLTSNIARACQRAGVSKPVLITIRRGGS